MGMKTIKGDGRFMPFPMKTLTIHTEGNEWRVWGIVGGKLVEKKGDLTTDMRGHILALIGAIKDSGRA